MIWLSMRWNVVNLAFAGLLSAYPLLHITP
jgi:hypothetical protein